MHLILKEAFFHCGSGDSSSRATAGPCAGIDGDVAGRKAFHGKTGVRDEQQGQLVARTGDGQLDGTATVTAQQPGVLGLANEEQTCRKDMNI